MESKFTSITTVLPTIIRSGDTEYFSGHFARWYDGTEATVYKPAPNVRETVDPKAFDQVIARGDRVELWFNHSKDFVLGSTDDGLILGTDEHGAHFLYPIDPNDIDHLRVRQKLEKGLVRGMSFQAKGTLEIKRDRQGHHRIIKSIDKLVEISLVHKPAYSGAEAIVRSEIDQWEKTQKLLEKIKALKAK